MSDDPFSVNPIYNAWLKAQGQMLEAQAPFWKQMSGAMSPSGKSDLSDITEKFWSDARQRGDEWISQFGSRLGFSGGDGGIAQETLQRMLDPGQFLFAGSDEINQTIQKLVEGPEFNDLATLENQGLKATKEWLALREASAEYRLVASKAWSRAFERFNRETAGDAQIWSSGPRVLINRWLEIANDELTASQRTEVFLKAQRKLLRAGVDYRLRERDMVEQWCETHSIPTRSEINDLHEIVYRLRKDVREVKKQLSSKKSASRTTSSRTKGRA